VLKLHRNTFRFSEWTTRVLESENCMLLRSRFSTMFAYFRRNVPHELIGDLRSSRWNGLQLTLWIDLHSLLHRELRNKAMYINGALRSFKVIEIATMAIQSPYVIS